MFAKLFSGAKKELTSVAKSEPNVVVANCLPISSSFCTTLSAFLIVEDKAKQPPRQARSSVTAT